MTNDIMTLSSRFVRPLHDAKLDECKWFTDFADFFKQYRFRWWVWRFLQKPQKPQLYKYEKFLIKYYRREYYHNRRDHDEHLHRLHCKPVLVFSPWLLGFLSLKLYMCDCAWVSVSVHFCSHCVTVRIFRMWGLAHNLRQVTPMRREKQVHTYAHTHTPHPISLVKNSSNRNDSTWTRHIIIRTTSFKFTPNDWPTDILFIYSNI